MKICGISDIHGNLIENIPECDVLCICGDIVTLNAQRNIEASKHWWETKFIKWIDKLPCKKVVVIPGNHDFYLEYKYKLNEWTSFKDYMQVLQYQSKQYKHQFPPKYLLRHVLKYHVFLLKFFFFLYLLPFFQIKQNTFLIHH